MNEIRKKWWVFSIQGLFLLTLGTLVLFSMGPDLPELIELLGVSLLLFGFIILLVSWLKRKQGRFIWNYVLGVLQALIGLSILIYSDQTVHIFGYTIGIWAGLISIWQIYLALRDKSKRWLYIINASVSALCTILIFINPFEDDRSAQIIGFYSILLGGFIIYFSIRFKRAAVYTIVDSQNKEPMSSENQEATERNSPEE
jgi:uncharacterized membrane protein HdeD (DUF308 family)